MEVLRGTGWAWIYYYEILQTKANFPLGKWEDFHKCKSKGALKLPTGLNVSLLCCFCVGFPHTLSGAVMFLYLFNYLYMKAKCSHVVSIRKREDPGNEKAVCHSPKNHHHFAAIILFYTCKMFVASLTWHFVSAKRLFRDLWSRTFHKYLTFVYFVKFILWTYGWESFCEKRARLTTSRICERDFSTLDVMFNEFAYEFQLKVFEESLDSDETPHQPRTFHKYLTIVCFCISFCFSPTIPWSG